MICLFPVRVPFSFFILQFSLFQFTYHPAKTGVFAIRMRNIGSKSFMVVGAGVGGERVDVLALNREPWFTRIIFN